MSAGHADGARVTPTYGIVGVTHAYVPGVKVLKDVSIELRGGRVRSLVGENGSGKSTLIKVLTGVLKPQVGTLLRDGEEISWSSPGDAQAHGIGVVHQDYHLFPDLTVAQNVVGVGRNLPRRRFTRGVDHGRIEDEVAQMLASLGIDIAPTRLVRSLDPAERKFVEIVRAMRLEPKFLILDEPTASLLPDASESVMNLIRRLRDGGLGLCFVSHRLDEVAAISDDVTCLRDGSLVAEVSSRQVDEAELAEMIVGRKVESTRRRGPRPAPDAEPEGPPALSVSNLKLMAGRPPVSFEVRYGEILGLTGLLGSGAAATVHMLGGNQPFRGEIEIDGLRRSIRTPRDAIKHGIGFVPEDRKSLGSVPELSVAINVSLPSLSEVSKAGVVDYWAMRERAERYTKPLDLRATSVDIPANSLSGGNLQKVVLAKWLASGARVLVIEEPTHGIDIGGKAQVHRSLRQFVDSGGAIIVALSDVDEALDLCDRIVIFRHGTTGEEVDAAQVSEAELRLMITRSGDSVTT